MLANILKLCRGQSLAAQNSLQIEQCLQSVGKGSIMDVDGKILLHDLNQIINVSPQSVDIDHGVWLRRIRGCGLRWWLELEIGRDRVVLRRLLMRIGRWLQLSVQELADYIMKTYWS